MLEELTIENLGVLPSATAEWAPGLTVLTGETGAGKTFLVSGLRLIVGGRADTSRIREGQDRAVVEGIFSLHEIPAPIRAKIEATLTEAGARWEDDTIVVSRSMTSKGRSRAHIGGRTVTASLVADVIQPILTVHGQHDQLRLLSPDQQREALDSENPEIAGILAEYRAHRATWRRCAKDLARRQEHQRDVAQEEDRLRFALAEIDAVDPQPGEDEALVEAVRRLQEDQEKYHAVFAALMALDPAGVLDADDTHQSISVLLDEAARALRNPQMGGKVASIVERLGSLSEEVADVTSELTQVMGELDIDPRELDATLERQAALANLTRKYAEDADGVIAWAENARRQLDSLDTSPEALERLTKETEQAAKTTKELAAQLTTARQKAARRLEEAVTKEIRGLAMPTASLVIHVTPTTRYGVDGVDEVEFQLKAHPQSPARPLSSAASGGELSRIMLAVEVVLSQDRRGSTIVFDEVDAGVGGRAAIEIGRRLMMLASHCQVIVVTHLPQVAAYADHHVVVTKAYDDMDATKGSGPGVTSVVTALDDNGRVVELARMLAGRDDTETGQAHAQELLDTAAAEREEYRAQLNA